MVAIISLLVGLAPEIPVLFGVVQKLIARGQATGELTPAETSALQLLAQSVFAQHSAAAPPPPGVTAGPA